jgi:hypothetical protein
MNNPLTIGVSSEDLAELIRQRDEFQTDLHDTRGRLDDVCNRLHECAAAAQRAAIQWQEAVEQAGAKLGALRRAMADGLGLVGGEFTDEELIAHLKKITALPTSTWPPAGPAGPAWRVGALIGYTGPAGEFTVRLTGRVIQPTQETDRRQWHGVIEKVTGDNGTIGDRVMLTEWPRPAPDVHMTVLPDAAALEPVTQHAGQHADRDADRDTVEPDTDARPA